MQDIAKVLNATTGYLLDGNEKAVSMDVVYDAAGDAGGNEKGCAGEGEGIKWAERDNKVEIGVAVIVDEAKPSRNLQCIFCNDKTMK